MQISLAEWKQLERILSACKQAIELADSQTFEVFRRHDARGNFEEKDLLFEINQRVHELRQQASFLHDVHPQSEWLGGDSDNPNNHTLREPNCCPLPRRRFTKEEIAAVGAVCQGPVQWTFLPLGVPGAS